MSEIAAGSNYTLTKHRTETTAKWRKKLITIKQLKQNANLKHKEEKHLT